MTNFRCPRCNSPKQERHPDDDRLFICQNCFALHDGDPDEGGPGYNDPAKAAAEKEAFQIRQKRRQQRPRYRRRHYR